MTSSPLGRKAEAFTDIEHHGHTYRCRCVVLMRPLIQIWHSADLDAFFVTEPGIKTTFHTTIRKAFSQAARHGGWG